MERFDQDERASDDQRKQNTHSQHETVEHREQNDKAVEAHRLEHLPTTFHVLEQIAVREHCAFGMPRCARSVNNHRQVLFGPNRLQSEQPGLRWRRREFFHLQNFEFGPRR